MRSATAATLLLFSLVHSAFAQCDAVRGPVKAGADADVQFVDAAPVPVTITALHELAAPRPLPQSARVMPVETTIFSLTATLTDIAMDSGSYRLTLTDDAGRTMLAVVPAADCVASTLAAGIATARAALAGRATPLVAEVQGLGFFDFLTGQTGAAPNGISLHPVVALNVVGTLRRRAVVGTNPRPTCTLPTVALQFSRNIVCPGESVTLTWQASDPTATVLIGGVGSNLPASGSTIIGTTTSLVYAARATNSCGVGPEALATLNVQQGASGSIGASPSSIQQNGSATVMITTANAVSWSVSSSLGNSLSPSSGTASGTVSIAYTGSRSGTDTITLTATGRACGTIQRSASILVNSSTPPPPPPPTGFLRCCDGTTSPTCTSCANKQGCCSSHKGVCGCP